jgi:homoserine trans-succinylase
MYNIGVINSYLVYNFYHIIETFEPPTHTHTQTHNLFENTPLYLDILFVNVVRTKLHQFTLINNKNIFYTQWTCVRSKNDFF